MKAMYVWGGGAGRGGKQEGEVKFSVLSLEVSFGEPGPLGSWPTRVPWDGVGGPLSVSEQASAAWEPTSPHPQALVNSCAVLPGTFFKMWGKQNKHPHSKIRPTNCAWLPHGSLHLFLYGANERPLEAQVQLPLLRAVIEPDGARMAWMRGRGASY